MTPTKLLDQYRKGLRDFRNSDLHGSNLSGSDLHGSNLSGSDLHGSNLSGSDLRGSNLSGSNLSWSDLSGSDLSGSDLSWSDLSGSDLRGATRGGRKLLSSGSIGSAPSSGRTVTWLIYETGEPEVLAGCFSGTPAALRKAARETHAEDQSALDWYLRVAKWIARDSKDTQARNNQTK